MRKVALIGANGQLGTDLMRELQKAHQVVPLTRKDLDICDHDRTREILTRLKPDVLINTAAYHRVDELEDQTDKAFQVNATAVRNLAKVCQDLGQVLVHISTDYVFGGDRSRAMSYREDDVPCPINVYGVSKLAGEYFVRDLCKHHFVVRSSGLYGVAGSSGKGGNFVELMLRLAGEGKPIRVVADQRLTPTYTLHLARQICALIATDKYGLYHATSQGSCTWHEFAAEIFHQSQVTPALSVASTGDFGEKAMRPGYSVLENKALQSLGIDQMSPWQEALTEYLHERPQSSHQKTSQS